MRDGSQSTLFNEKKVNLITILDHVEVDVKSWLIL